MPSPLPEAIDVGERLAATCTGDVDGMIGAARARLSNVDDAGLAAAFELAARRRAAAGDRTAAWWLACAVVTLRPSPLATPQEDAELVAARSMGELAHSPAARAPLPEPARWLVAATAEPAPTLHTLELARGNARRHLERLDAELAARLPSLRARCDAARGHPGALADLERAVNSFALGLAATRAALDRALDHLVARSGDPALVTAADSARAELDDAPRAALVARIAGARSLIASAAGSAPPRIDVAPDAGGDRPSFAGAAPPSFRTGSTGAPAVAPASLPIAAPAASPPRHDELDRAMNSAFERAWTAPSPESRAAFVAAVRARYELETSTIADPEARQRALDHYVAHALAQLPPG